ncbi:hypothetical protein MBAV_004345 [Candidatus Magnetobacterium bavaricum]|uniref:Uncharacterized protein n=1 Tax=Candidatus Magnetobacterium bavaricum TaxID=29290 RepID=A0A0F3GNJ9_9BACT|nr:hypothetical protein MBAV_004345 [Candidatus Magnetobacterium bavaricum]
MEAGYKEVPWPYQRVTVHRGIASLKMVSLSSGRTEFLGIRSTFVLRSFVRYCSAPTRSSRLIDSSNSANRSTSLFFFCSCLAYEPKTAISLILCSTLNSSLCLFITLLISSNVVIIFSPTLIPSFD